MAERIKTWHPYAIREYALALHSGGLGFKRIAKRMELPANTVKTWIHRYGQHRKVARLTTNAVEIIEEEVSGSVELIPLTEAGKSRVFLVSGPYDFRGKIDGFAAKIPEELAQNLIIGDIFVFCRRTRYQISALQWQGDGFVIMFKRTEEERYPWPTSAQIKVIEISREDLKTLLEYPQFIRRLSGLATPEGLA